MSRLLKSQNYLMKCMGFVLLFAFISLGGIAGCSDNDDGATEPASRCSTTDECVEVLLSTNSCAGCNLVGADLRGADLREADLTQAVLYQAYLREADLRGANLTEADLRFVEMPDADLSGANCQNANFSGVKDSRDPECILNNTLWVGANLSGARFEFCEMQGADLSEAIFTGAKLEYAYLREADLSGADISQEEYKCFLLGVILRRANLRDVDLSGQLLLFSDWSGADLSEANLTMATLMGVKLNDALLVRANLTGANLMFLPSLNLTGADFSEATWCDGMCICAEPSISTCVGCPPPNTCTNPLPISCT